MSLARPAATATAPLDDRDDRCHYVGLLTRTLAFALDAAVINGVALVVGAIASLVLSVLTLPSELATVTIAVGGAAYLVWGTAYFVTFWSTLGQTPGDRVLRFRVCGRDGQRIGPGRALLRFAALWLAALPLFAGYLLILVDDRRRGLHDLLARTVVIDDAQEERAGRLTANVGHTGGRRRTGDMSCAV